MHPHEFMRELGFPADFVLPANLPVAMHQVGNTISPIHAFYAYMAADKALGHEHRTHEEALKEAFTPLHDMRLFEIREDTEWTTLRQKRPSFETYQEFCVIARDRSMYFTRCPVNSSIRHVVERALPRAISQRVTGVQSVDCDDMYRNLEEQCPDTHLIVECKPLELRLGKDLRVSIDPHETVEDVQQILKRDHKLQEPCITVDGIEPDADTRMWKLVGHGIWVKTDPKPPANKIETAFKRDQTDAESRKVAARGRESPIAKARAGKCNAWEVLTQLQEQGDMLITCFRRIDFEMRLEETEQDREQDKKRPRRTQEEKETWVDTASSDRRHLAECTRDWIADIPHGKENMCLLILKAWRSSPEGFEAKWWGDEAEHIKDILRWMKLAETCQKMGWQVKTAMRMKDKGDSTPEPEHLWVQITRQEDQEQADALEVAQMLSAALTNMFMRCIERQEGPSQSEVCFQKMCLWKGNVGRGIRPSDIRNAWEEVMSNCGLECNAMIVDCNSQRCEHLLWEKIRQREDGIREIQIVPKYRVWQTRSKMRVALGGHPQAVSKTIEEKDCRLEEESESDSAVKWRLDLATQYASWCGDDEIEHYLQKIRSDQHDIAAVLVVNTEQGTVQTDVRRGARTPERPKQDHMLWPMCVDGHWCAIHRDHNDLEQVVRWIGVESDKQDRTWELVKELIGTGKDRPEMTQVPTVDVPDFCGFALIFAIHQVVDPALKDLPTAESFNMEDNHFLNQRFQKECDRAVATFVAACDVLEDEIFQAFCMQCRLDFLHHVIDKGTRSPERISWGGGAKSELATKAISTAAHHMLGLGHTLEEATDVSERLVKAAGHEAVTRILTTRVGRAMHDAQLRDLAKAVSVTWPIKIESQRSISRPSERPRQQKTVVRAEHFAIETDMFRNQDDTEVNAIETVSPNATGIILMNPQDAAPWVQEPKRISADELGILIMAQTCPMRGSEHCNPMHVPARNSQGEPVILNACLHQLGQKDIKIKKKGDSVAVEETHVMAFTCYCEEVTQEQWQNVLTNPVKTTMHLAGLGEEGTIAGPPWARSWHNAKGKCKPHEAASLQFHARVREDKLQQCLQVSGRHGIYTLLRESGNKPSTKYSIIWVQSPTIDALKVLAPDIEHFGCIRSNKNTTRISRGIRVKRQDFEMAFKRLRPGEPIPAQEPIEKVIKVQPMPPGATHSEIEKWIHNLQWPARPLKSLSGTVWLLGVTDKKWVVPAFTTWNEQAVMIREVQPKTMPSRNPIVAGRPPQMPTVHAQQQPPEDPWMAYRVQHKIETAPSARPNHMPRQTEGPVEERFNKQQKQLDEMRDKLAHIEITQSESKTSAERRHKEMQDDIHQMRQEQTEKQQSTENRINALQRDFSENMKSMVENLQQSITQAISAQESRVDSRCDRLEALLLEGPKNSPMRKVAKGGNKGE